MKNLRIVRGAEVALFCAVLLGHLAAFLWASASTEFTSYTAAAAVDSIVVGQAALLTILAFLGPGKWFVRWPFVLICFTGIVVAQSGYRSDYLYILLVFQTAALISALLVMRGAGFWIVRQPDRSRQAIQFSMRTMLVATGVFAVGMTMTGILRSQPDEYSRAIVVGGLGLTFATGAILTLWLVLRSQNLWLALAVLLPLAPLLGLLPTYLLRREADWRIFSGWTSGFVAILACTFLLLRMGSWNLVRRGSIFTGLADRWIRGKQARQFPDRPDHDPNHVRHSVNGLAEVSYECD